MDTLDNMHDGTEETSFLPVALKYGLIGSGIAVVISLLSFNLGWADGSNLMMSMLVGLISVAIYVVMQIFAVRTFRDEEVGGYITFGKAFATALVTALVIAVIGSLFNYIYMSFIDPEFMTRMADNMREMYEGWDMPEESIDAAVQAIEESGSAGKQLLNGLIMGGVFGGISGLIVAAVMKKEPPLA